MVHYLSYFFLFFKQKTAYERRISDCSSDVCSSDLALHLVALIGQFEADPDAAEIIAQLTAKGCSGLGVELRVEAIVRRSEERRVEKAGVRPCRSRGTP